VERKRKAWEKAASTANPTEKEEKYAIKSIMWEGIREARDFLQESGKSDLHKEEPTCVIKRR